MFGRTLRILAALGLLALSASPVLAFQQVTGFDQAKSNPGNLSMYWHVPSDLKDPAPLVVALHGCQQTATNYHDQSGWSELADREGFIVIYPQQNTEINGTGNNYKCFNWAGHYGDNLGRGEGENQSIKEMVDYVKERHNVNNDKVYVTGLSAGGAMATVMAASWPEIFAGAAPMAGIPYRCANIGVSPGDGVPNAAYACMGVTSSFQPRSGCPSESGEACMDPNKKRDPQTWGDQVRNVGHNHSGQYPRFIIWQGTVDQYVDDDNAIELMKQWTNVHGTDQQADVTGRIKDGDSNHNFREYWAGGQPVVAVVEVQGMKHGISVDPGTGEDQGGTALDSLFGGGYSFDRNVHSTYYTAQWWGLLDDEPTNPSPVVEITSPAAAAVVDGTVNVAANATDDVSVDRVEFYLNGDLIGTDSSAPYQASFSTDALSAGSHTVSAVAYDNEGAEGEDSVNVIVEGDEPVNLPPEVTITSPSAGATVSGTITIRFDGQDDDGIDSYTVAVDGDVIKTISGTATQTTLNTTNLSNGNRTITIVAEDASADSLTGEDSVSVNVSNSQTVNCEEWTTYNWAHASAGRAKNVSWMWWYPDYRVVGSDESLGRSSYTQTTVRTTEVDGEFAKGSCP